jgi:hypothetical protein
MCQTHRTTPKVDEGVVNAYLASLTSAGNPDLARAIAVAIWGTEIPTKCGVNCTPTSFVVASSQNDADWILTCTHCSKRVARAEHKPRFAPVHVSRTKTAALRTKAVLKPKAWTRAVAESCGERDHDPSECTGRHPWYRQFLAVPQVLAYSFRDELMHVTIITDHPNAKNPADLYSSEVLAEFPLTLNPKYFPLRKTATVLNELAAALTGVDLSGQKLSNGTDVRATLVSVIEAMWARAGRPELTPVADAWIRPDAPRLSLRPRVRRRSRVCPSPRL